MSHNISIVVPVYNERDNIKPFIEKVHSVLTNAPQLKNYEIIFVDDASTDGTRDIYSTIKIDRIHVIYLPSHGGQSGAIQAGFPKAQYELIATLDADLQNDPVDLPNMVSYINQGADFVQGWRRNRNDAWDKVLISRLANWAHRIVLKDNFKDIGCSTRLFKKTCVQNIDFFNGAHRFLPYLVQQAGFKVVECEVNHLPRTSGASKYGIWNRLFKTLGDLIRVKLG